MSASVYFKPRVISDSCVRIIRRIKDRGTLTVAKNQEVSPHDVLGTSQISVGFTVINLAKELKLSPKEAIASLKKTTGTPIYKGELLAEKKSLFGGSHFLAPTDCTIERTNEVTGELTLKYLPKNVPLLAGVYGIVDEINTLTGQVYIKTIATQIIGLFGSGRERGGFLKIIGGPSDLTHQNNITPDLRGTIVVTGGLIFGPALKRAMEYQLDGIISGGLNFDDYLAIAGSIYENHKSHSEIGMSLIATEGFGPMPIGNDIYKILKSFENKYAFINGFRSRVILPESSADSILVVRKISLPPIQSENATLPETQTVSLIPGMKVRLVWPPFAGNQGFIVSIDKNPTLLPSGISALCAVVELSNTKLKVPLQNLEAI